MSGEQGWRGIETTGALGDKYVIPPDKIADVSGGLVRWGVRHATLPRSTSRSVPAQAQRGR